MSFTYEYPRPVNTADAAVFKLIDNRWHILLIRRGSDPHKGCWALPGGHMEMNEELGAAAARELMEETGLKDIELKQFHTFSTLKRDPRDRYITTVYTATLKTDQDIIAGSDANDVAWVPFERLKDLPIAFDHSFIITSIISTIDFIT